MTTQRPSLTDIDVALGSAPGEAYAAQRKRGFRLLRFAPALEAEYLTQMRQDQRVSTLICVTTALAIWLVFAGLDLTRLDLRAEYAARHVDALVVVGLRALTLTVVLALIACLLGGRLPTSYQHLSLFSLVLIGVAAAVISNIYKLRGLPQADLAEFAIMMAVFLPVGLTFRQSLLAATLVALTIAVAGRMMLDSSNMGEHLRLSAMLFFAGFVGAVGAYLREYAQRDKFLLRRLLHHYAMQDSLTGIGNRRHFQENATVALQQARRDGAAVTLAILDVDHFKRYNDRYGHHAGDMALKEVAGRIAACLRRPLDLAGRLGGEEFGILLYGAGPGEAPAILDGIVEAVAGLAIRHEASATADHLTVSIGAACFDGRESLESLYRRADGALYEAKAAGRNRAMLLQAVQVAALATRAPRIQRRR